MNGVKELHNNRGIIFNQCWSPFDENIQMYVNSNWLKADA